jgi:hypothetical protein
MDLQQTLENTKEAIKNKQTKETVKIGCIGRRKTKQKHNMR